MNTLPTFLIDPAKIRLPEDRMRALARELAMDLLPREVIFEAYSITDQDWDYLAVLPAFSVMLDDARRQWSSGLTTKERIDLKTQIIIEEMLPKLAEYMTDPKFSDNAKVEIFKTLQKGAGIGVTQGNGSGAERVSITINMGADKQLKAEFERPIIDVTPNES